MGNDTTEKSLAQIGFEAVRPPPAWNAAGPALQEMSQDFAAAVEAEVRHRQPSPAMAGELTEEEALKSAFDEFGGSRDAWDTWDDDRKDLFRRVFQRLSIPATPPVMDCVWSENDEAGWSTQCGNDFTFTEDGPAENKFKNCPYCGGHLIPAPVSPVTAEEAEIERLAEVLWMANDHENLPYKEAREYGKNIHRKMARAIRGEVKKSEGEGK